jgi:hypothetical protein
MLLLSQKEKDNKLDSMKIQLHRNLLQPPVCSQYLPSAPSTLRLLQMLQLKHLHCRLHNKTITPLATLQRKGEGSATAAAVELQHNVPARTDRCRESKHFAAELTSANYTATKQAKSKPRSERISKDTRAAH